MTNWIGVIRLTKVSINQRSYDDAVKLFKEEGFSGASLGLVEAIIHKIDKDHFYQFSEIVESV